MLSFYLPPVLYLVGSLMNDARPPSWAWWRVCAPPDYLLGAASVAVLKVFAQLATAWCWSFLFSAFKQLQPQILQMYVGRGSVSGTAETGPYDRMRHPIYCGMLVQQLVFAVLCWTYIPLAALPVTAGVFMLKIPREEHMHEVDPTAGVEYIVYKNKVHTRLIPGIW
ncbi:hypothetical protein BKA93DRAFT_736146 [Sparassis latifolia]